MRLVLLESLQGILINEAFNSSSQKSFMLEPIFLLSVSFHSPFQRPSINQIGTHTYKLPFFCCFSLSLVQNKDNNKGCSIVGVNMEFLTRSQRCT